MFHSILSKIVVAAFVCCFAIWLTGCNESVGVRNLEIMPIEDESKDESTNVGREDDISFVKEEDVIEKTDNMSGESAPAVQAEDELLSPDSTGFLGYSTILDDLGSGNTTAGYREVNVIISGRDLSASFEEIGQSAIEKDGEVLVPAGVLAFENLAGADGSTGAGFGTFMSNEPNESVKAVIANQWYTVTLTDEADRMICNDETIPLDVPAQIMNGQFMLPLKAIANAISATVEWDEELGTISVFYESMIQVS